MRFEFIQAEKVNYPLVVLCRVLLVSTSGFYAWASRDLSDQQLRREALAKKAKAAHEASRGTYGSPRVTRELRKAGESVSEKTVARIMREEGIAARKKRRFKATTDSKNTKRIAKNLVQRVFSSPTRDRVWVTDVTAVWTVAGGSSSRPSSTSSLAASSAGP